MKLKIQLQHPNAKAPTYGTDGAACFDLYAATINGAASIGDIAYPGHPLLCDTGVAFEVPDGYMLQVRSRSGRTRGVAPAARVLGAALSVRSGPCGSGASDRPLRAGLGVAAARLCERPDERGRSLTRCAAALSCGGGWLIPAAWRHQWLAPR